jgi:hypothetical protein
LLRCSRFLEISLNETEFVPPPVPEIHQALDAFEKYLYAANTYPPPGAPGSHSFSVLPHSGLVLNESDPSWSRWSKTRIGELSR